MLCESGLEGLTEQCSADQAPRGQGFMLFGRLPDLARSAKMARGKFGGRFKLIGQEVGKVADRKDTTLGERCPQLNRDSDDRRHRAVEQARVGINALGFEYGVSDHSPVACGVDERRLRTIKPI